MAPRKRTTKKNNPKTAKLEAFLADFDGEGKYFSFWKQRETTLARPSFESNVVVMLTLTLLVFCSNSELLKFIVVTYQFYESSIVYSLNQY